MTYASWHTDWNKLVRDNIPSGLEAKGIHTSSRIVEDKQELIMLLGHKLMEEMAELENALAQTHQEKIFEEAADVQEVHEKLFSLLKTYNGDEIDWYDAIITLMWKAEYKINSTVTKQNHELIEKLKDIKIKKREEKGWFEKWIFLISTDS